MEAIKVELIFSKALGEKFVKTLLPELKTLQSHYYKVQYFGGETDKEL